MNAQKKAIIAAVAVILALILIVAVYTLKQTSGQQPQQLLQLQDQSQNQAPTPAQNEEVAPMVDDSMTYQNETYNFSLVFPRAWQGYKTANRMLSWGSLGTSNSIDFGFVEQPSLFNISVHTAAQWKNIISMEGPKPVYLGEDGVYVYAYALAQDAGNETLRSRFAEVADILKTFSLENK